MISITPDFPDYEFVIAGAPSLDKDFYTTFLNGKNVKYIQSKTYDLLSISKAALVTSGTATLETALFKVPQVVCYKANCISYQIAKRIITLDYISLVNLIMKKEVVKELIQDDLTKDKLTKELKLVLLGEQREMQLKAYEQLTSKLGGSGASKKAATLIMEYAKS
jgi:lipid-A-disaccharide synthase